MTEQRRDPAAFLAMSEAEQDAVLLEGMAGEPGL
jgi:hypothetical protein